MLKKWASAACSSVTPFRLKGHRPKSSMLGDIDWPSPILVIKGTGGNAAVSVSPH